MLEQPEFVLKDPETLRELVRRHPWATLVSDLDGELVVSHLPVLVANRHTDHDDNDKDVVPVVGHLARADAELHQLGQHPVVLIVQGPHGYLSASWYRDGPHVPTWDFVVLHLHGRPTLLGPDDTLRVLSDTVDHLEAARPEPWRLDSVPDYARRLLPATSGFVLHPQRVVGKAKLSQDQPAHEVARLADALAASDPAPSGQMLLAQALRDTLRPA